MYDVPAAAAALEKLRGLAARLEQRTAPSDADLIMLQAIRETLDEYGRLPRPPDVAAP